VCRDHFRARCSVPLSRGPRVRRHDRAGCSPATQCVSFGIFHARRLPRAARHRRPHLARGDDGAGGGQRLPRDRAAPPAVLLPVLARARHHLGRAIHRRLSDGSRSMTAARYDSAPGDTSPPSEPSGVLVYTIGLFLAVALTATSFWVANTSLLWGP